MDELAPGVHLHADQLGQELRDPERGQERNAWTTPRTWVATEVVTASIMNLHVRDNLSVLSVSHQVGSFVGEATQSSSILINGADQTMTDSNKILVDASTVFGLTFQVRCLIGLTIGAVNGCTSFAMTAKLRSVYKIPIATNETFTVGAYGSIPLSVGDKSYDTGWVTLTDTEINLCEAVYRGDFATAAPTITLLHLYFAARAI